MWVQAISIYNIIVCMRVCCLYALSHCSMPNYLCSFTSNCKKVQTLQSTMLSQIPLACDYEDYQHFKLVYTTQVNRTFRARWLVGSEVISQVLFTSKQPKKTKMAFVGILSQIKLLFGPQVIQLAWYILKQLFTSVSVKVWYLFTLPLHCSVNIRHYSPPLQWIIVK